MKLDPRIKSLSDVFNSITDVERAKQFIGHEGYFANEIEDFADLGRCVYGKLSACDDVYFGQYSYYCYWSGEGRTESFMIFIPADSLKPIKRKKYRPYTPEEFCDKFAIGRPIKIKKDDIEGSGEDLILQGLWYKRRDDKMIACAHIGPRLIALDDLFYDYEWRRSVADDFEPFSVEVEE